MSKEKNQDKRLLENPEALADKVRGLESWAQTHPRLLGGVLAVLILGVAAFLAYRYYINRLNTQAQQQMFQAQRYFEADSLSLALNGDGNNLGFVDIIQEFSGTKAANLANFYAGACFLKQGNYETAILYLKDFEADDMLVQPRAYSLIGDAHMELEQYEAAARYYSRAADYRPNRYFTPGYLMKAALAYEKLNDKERAIAAYDKVINMYWESAEYTNARKYKIRLQGAS